MLHRALATLVVLAGFFPLPTVWAGTVTGYLRDQNWYAQYSSNPYGVGYYEFAVNGNGSNVTSLGAVAATDVYGYFSSSVTAGGLYTICSWDVWWRSAYAFNLAVPPAGSTTVDLRLKAAMWGYPAFWDDAGYTEYGQTFVATGPISMIYLRLPYFTGAPTYHLTVREGGPGGAQVGEERVFGTGDQRPIYSYGQMPTVAGRTYYARVTSSTPGVIMQMDPRPDFSDPMPGGCLWLGSVDNVQSFPDRDLGLVIMSDDDGLVTDMYTRSGGSSLSGPSVGQTFTARGVNLISVAAWLPESPAPTYQFAVYADGPGGALVGTVKSGMPARVTADPEVLVTWAPGECPLTPGKTYYLEITRPGGWVYGAMANPNNPYAYGDAYQGQSLVSGTDLAGTIMEEQSAGSAILRPIKNLTGPQISENERNTNSLTVRWATDVASDSKVEFALDTPPYTRAVYDPRLLNSHVMVLPGLKPNAMYHYRVSSSATNCRPLVSRDLVICTKASQTNLLLNPGFEEGLATTAASRPVTNWTGGGNLDIKESNGTWFWGVPPHSGAWLLEGAVNNNVSDGYIYQQVPVTPGKNYTFSAWVTTWMREGSPDAWKYDVWYDRNRLIYIRLGIDPFGGTDPQSGNIQWTPRMYSHLHYSNIAKTATAQAGFITAFISMKGNGGTWELYGVDDCVLTETAVSQPFWSASQTQPDGSFTAQIVGDVGVMNTIQVSTNLVDWTDLTQLPQTNAVVTFADPAASRVGNLYYRAVVTQ